MTSPLFVDVSPWQPSPNWSALAKLGAPWHGGIVKVSEGLAVNRSWFESNWIAARLAFGDRYGKDWFRGAYHFLRFADDGAKQADLYLGAIDKAGGYQYGDLWPIVDVELGGEKHPNYHAERNRIIDVTTAFADRIRQITGRATMLYGNGAMRDRGIISKMGCSYLWCPRYTASLPREMYERAGWTQDELVLWQYGGGERTFLAGYPSAAPGFGGGDVSVLVRDGGLTWLRSRLWAEKP